MGDASTPVERIFSEALLRTDPDQRAAFLDEACGGDVALRRRVEALLGAHDDAGSFLSEPPGVAAVAAAADPSRFDTLNADLGIDGERTSAAARPVRLRAPVEAAGSVIDHYKLLQQIGEGGFGVVYMAEQDEPVRRRVALKVIKAGMDTRAVIARFEAERQALAMMDHPNIARVFDAGTTEQGRPYFVMELVTGIPITDYCDQSQLATRQRLALFVDVCRAVQHAHQKGIIHRDLKPSNIMVTLHDDRPVVKVIDFGIAKATEQRLTEKTLFTGYGQMIGTPTYMSPEQAAMTDFDVDTRSDVYSLGVLLYEMLTGSPPFDAQALRQAGIDEMRRIIREEQPPKPSTKMSTMAQDARLMVAGHRQATPQALSRQLHGDLDWIVLKAIEKDRARRYESASALAHDIERHLNSEPVLAGAPGTVYRLRKFARRNSGPIAAAAAIVVMLLAGTAVSAWQAVRATAAERKTAETLKQVAAERDAKVLALRLVAAERDAKVLALSDAEDISKLMAQVLERPNPGLDGRKVTVVDALSNVAKRLDVDLASQPGRRAKLQTALGNTFSALGLNHEAGLQYEKAAESMRTAHGPDHPDTIWARSAVGHNYRVERRFDEAIKIGEEILPLFEKAFGPESQRTLHTTLWLGDAYAGAGRTKQALALRQALLPRTVEALGQYHPQTLWTMAGLAQSLRAAGEREESLKYCESVLFLRRLTLGPEHPDTLWAMHKLSQEHYQDGRTEEALQLAEETAQLMDKVLGPKHGYTSAAVNQLAQWRTAAGLAEASPPTAATSPSDASPEEVAKSENTYTLQAMKVAGLQAWAGKGAEYEATCQRTLAWAAGTTSAQVANRVAKLSSLRPADDGDGAAASERQAAALTLARKAVQLGKGTASAPWHQLSLGMAEYRSGHHAAADAALANAAESAAAAAQTASPVPGKDAVAFITNTAAFYCAMSLLQQGKSAEARDLFTATAAKMKPLPADEQNPPAAGTASSDDLILWLAYKEAKALID